MANPEGTQLGYLQYGRGQPDHYIHTCILSTRSKTNRTHRIYPKQKTDLLRNSKVAAISCLALRNLKTLESSRVTEY